MEPKGVGTVGGENTARVQSGISKETDMANSIRLSINKANPSGPRGTLEQVAAGRLFCWSNLQSDKQSHLINRLKIPNEIAIRSP